MEKARNRGLRRKSSRIVEPLEVRRLCSVTVTQGYPGYYQIDGDNGANAIVVSVNQNAATFSLNGVSYSGVSYIAINGYGGNDYVSVSGSPGNIGCSINEGDGNDFISLSFDGAIWAGNGNDSIYLKDAFQGQVSTGTGNDYINLSGQCANAAVYAGGGNDYIDCSQNLYDVLVFGGNGSDTIVGSSAGDQIYLGSSSNVVYADGDTVYANNGYSDVIYGNGSSNNVVYADSFDQVYNVQNVYSA